MMNEEKKLRILESKKRYREKNAKPKTALTQRVHNWFPCSCCLAKIGFGAKKASKIIGVISYGTIGGKWLELGIERYRPPSGNWKQAISPALSALKPKVEKPKIKKICAQKEYEAACMISIRSHRKFTDWSHLWLKEMSRRAALKKYQSMSKEDRIANNKKLWESRKKDPEKMRKCKERAAKWKSMNPEKNREAVKKANKKRKAIDPGYRVQCNLRNRLKDLMQTARNGGSDHISRLIGCTTKQLARHLESKFNKGMAWSNYGTHWHVDHVLPCSSFNHFNDREVRQCWHYSNLAPLEAEKNLKKSATITEPQMQLLLCSHH